jgi:prevent-host-death family protein
MRKKREFAGALTIYDWLVKLVRGEQNMLSQQIGIFEAKTHLSEIIEKVESGADFIITKRGKPTAKIIPIEQGKKVSRKEVIEEFRELRKHYKGKPGSFNIREAIEKGRR